VRSPFSTSWAEHDVGVEFGNFIEQHAVAAPAVLNVEGTILIGASGADQTAEAGGGRRRLRLAVEKKEETRKIRRKRKKRSD